MSLETSCYKLVADQFPLVSSLKWLKINGETVLLGWHRENVIIFRLTEEICRNLQSPLAEPCAYERIRLTNDVLDIVQWKHSIYVLDACGRLLSLVNDNSSDMEDDIFDDDMLQTQVWRVNQVMELEKDTIALATCLTAAGLAVLHLTEGCMVVSTVSLDVHPCVTSKKGIQNYPPTSCSNRDLISKSIMLFIPRHEVGPDILSSLLPSYNEPFSEEGILVVGLPNGTICCVTVSGTTLTAHFALKWPFHAVAGCLTSSGSNGSVSTRKSLLILFNGGTLAQFSNFSLEHSYIPLSKVRTGCFIGETVVASDFFDTYVSYLNGQNLTSYIAPIKGAVCFCPFSTGDSNVIVVTKHRALYILSLGEKEHQNAVLFTKKIPDETLFDQFVGLSQHLEQINQKIEARDEYLRAMSVALSSDHLIFDFDVQIVAVYGNVHLLRTTLHNRMPELVFSSKIWHFMISVFSTSKCFTLVRDLEHDLTWEAALEDVFKFELSGDDRNFTAVGRLQAVVDSHVNYWPSLKIGEVSLGIDNYVQPVSSLRIQEMLTTRTDDLVFESSAASVSVSNSGNDPTSIESLPKRYSFRLFGAPSQGWIQEFLGKSRALWRFTEWSNLDDWEKVDVVIGCDKYSFHKFDSEVQVCGRNVVKCYLLKLSMLQTLKRTNFLIPADEDFLMEIDSLLKELEIHEFTTDNHSIDILKATFDRKEAFVLKQLIGSQSFLPD